MPPFLAVPIPGCLMSKSARGCIFTAPLEDEAEAEAPCARTALYLLIGSHVTPD